MQPIPPPRRPARMPRVGPALAALSLALALGSVPLARASACSCEMSELPDAIATAEIAIVGTSEGSVEVGRNDMGERVQTTWTVERSRDPVLAPSLRVESWRDSGANCGISFAAGERWLVLAYRGDATLETNGCMQNRRLDGSDPEAEAVVAELLTEVSVPEQAAEGPQIPAPLLGIALVALLVGAASLLAFRRGGVR